MEKAKKLPRIPKPDHSKYLTGDNNDNQKYVYEYTYEDLIVALSIRECETEPSPTFKQVYLYGVVSEIFKNIEDQLSISDRLLKDAKNKWQKMVDEINKEEN